MKKLITPYTEFINEVKLQKKKDFLEEDVYNLPEFLLLQQYGFYVNKTNINGEKPKIDTVILYLSPHAVKPKTTEVRDRLIELDENKNQLVTAIFGSHESIAFTGFLTDILANHSVKRISCPKLTSIDKYNEAFKSLRLYFEKLANNSSQWEPIKILDSDTIDNNRIDNITGNTIDNLW